MTRPRRFPPTASRRAVSKKVLSRFVAAGAVAAAGWVAAGPGCAPNRAPMADAAAVEEVAGLAGEPLPPSGAGWTADIAAARAAAAAEDKDVLMLFTGSDWCHFCKLLDAQVFAHAPASRLTDDFVPVVLDFADGGSRPAAEAFAAQHITAAGRYGIEGFPTVVLTDPAGTAYARLGYDRRYADEGAAAFVADAKAAKAGAGGVQTVGL